MLSVRDLEDMVIKQVDGLILERRQKKQKGSPLKESNASNFYDAEKEAKKELKRKQKEEKR